MSIADYSATPGSNLSISGTSLAEGCNASGINDAIRQMMADIAAALAAGQFHSPGEYMHYAGYPAPAGWLLCDGAGVSRTTYAALFGVIGTNYGAGDGSTTFNVPDLRGRMLLGAGAGSGLTNRTVGASGGEENHTLSTAEVPALTVSGTAASDGTHGHGVSDPTHSHSYNEPAVVNGPAYTIGTSNLSAHLADGALSTGAAATGISVTADGAHTHAVSGTTNGSGGAHNNMPPFTAGSICIKT